MRGFRCQAADATTAGLRSKAVANDNADIVGTELLPAIPGAFNEASSSLFKTRVVGLHLGRLYGDPDNLFQIVQDGAARHGFEKLSTNAVSGVRASGVRRR